MTQDPTKSPAVSEREDIARIVHSWSSNDDIAWEDLSDVVCAEGDGHDMAKCYYLTAADAILARLAPAPEKVVREADDWPNDAANAERYLRIVTLAEDWPDDVRREAVMAMVGWAENQAFKAAVAQPEAARVGEDRDMQREIEILRRALAWHGDPQRMATTREDWQQTIDAAIVWVKANPEDGYASFSSYSTPLDEDDGPLNRQLSEAAEAAAARAGKRIGKAIDARLASTPAPRNANETGQDEALRGALERIGNNDAPRLVYDNPRRCVHHKPIYAECHKCVAAYARAALATQPAAGSEG